MDKLDELVLNQLANKVFSSERLQAMIAELRRHTRNSKDSQQERINQLNRQLKLLEDRQQRLFDAVETGVLELGENLQRRAQQLKAARDALLIEWRVFPPIRPCPSLTSKQSQ